ncbi:thioredoxin domain-containing protein [Epidermidibacterium keratini]|uniref:Thioredoxin domain-containing protein n=1 Tax=Epidermidibacterium keratini TaxID=1891644 RepID=A0A7L4YTH4_9ACTN|nr:thioredoxin domain-containing protein [Epidermidibacterium keratini]QHC01827.1 thioredoxin domain-containing protein [Epidermidibacterium keratini]
MANSNKKRNTGGTGASAGKDAAKKAAAGAKASTAKSGSQNRPSGKGGAVKVGDTPKRTKSNAGKPSGRGASGSSKAVADARKAASRSGSQLWLWVGAAVVVVALAVAGVIAINNRSDEASALPDGFPQGQLVDNNTLVYGDDSAPAKVDWWVDLLCPACRQFETAAAETIEKAVADGKAQLRVHPVNILEQQSNPPGYSTRAGSAVMCAAESGKSYQLMKTLYEEQPAEGGPGLTDGELVDMATGGSVGAPSSIEQCITDGTYADSVNGNTQQFDTNGFTGTPTVLVNDQQTQGVDAMSSAIEAAQG